MSKDMGNGGRRGSPYGNPSYKKYMKEQSRKNGTACFRRVESFMRAISFSCTVVGMRAL